MTEVDKRVRVKMKVGDIEVEVECNVDEIGGVVDRVLGVIAERGEAVSGVAKSSGVVGKGGTCKGLLVNLWNEGWFSAGRSLGEVHGELGRRGFHYDRTAVAHALVDLVRESVLSRLGRPRRFVYVQKRPPPKHGVGKTSG